MSTNSEASFTFRASSGAVVLSSFFFAPARAPAEPQRGDRPITAQAVTSKDETRIAYDKQGKGPALVVVGGALSDRKGSDELARSFDQFFVANRKS